MSILGPSLASTIRNSKSLSKFFSPIAGWYANMAGYRQHGLKYDDLIIEESDTAQKALSRLTEREQYDRAYRIRVASQLSILHKELPKSEWVKPEDDKRYLTPLIKEIEVEHAERAKWDAATLQRPSH